jgi:hypothetical protein
LLKHRLRGGAEIATRQEPVAPAASAAGIAAWRKILPGDGGKICRICFKRLQWKSKKTARTVRPRRQNISQTNGA